MRFLLPMVAMNCTTRGLTCRAHAALCCPGTAVDRAQYAPGGTAAHVQGSYMKPTGDYADNTATRVLGYKEQV